MFSCSQSKVPTVIGEEYSFLLPDGEVRKISQSQDTLYEYKCFIEWPCEIKPEMHAKILDTYKSGDFTILKLQWLDTIPLKDQFCPGKIFSIMALKNIGKNEFGYLHPFQCLTQQQLDTTQMSSLFLNKKNYLTYFSNTYLKELSTLKKVSTKSAVKEIMNAIENNDFHAGKISYSAEQLNRACIKKGYNPVHAGLTIDSILKTY